MLHVPYVTVPVYLHEWMNEWIYLVENPRVWIERVCTPVSENVCLCIWPVAHLKKPTTQSTQDKAKQKSACRRDQVNPLCPYLHTVHSSQFHNCMHEFFCTLGLLLCRCPLSSGINYNEIIMLLLPRPVLRICLWRHVCKPQAPIRNTPTSAAGVWRGCHSLQSSEALITVAWLHGRLWRAWRGQSQMIGEPRDNCVISDCLPQRRVCFTKFFNSKLTQ